jgi:hypothetical protein
MKNKLPMSNAQMTPVTFQVVLLGRRHLSHTSATQTDRFPNDSQLLPLAALPAGALTSLRSPPPVTICLRGVAAP